MNRIAVSIEKTVAKNFVNAKRIKDKLYLKTENLIDESEMFMRRAETQSELVVVTAQGRAPKIMEKVL